MIKSSINVYNVTKPFLVRTTGDRIENCVWCDHYRGFHQNDYPGFFWDGVWHSGRRDG